MQSKTSICKKFGVWIVFVLNKQENVKCQNNLIFEIPCLLNIYNFELLKKDSC